MRQSNRKCVKFYRLNYKILTFDSRVLPKTSIFVWIYFHNKIKENIECYVKNYSFHLYILCLEQILAIILNFITIQIWKLIPWVNNTLKFWKSYFPFSFLLSAYLIEYFTWTILPFILEWFPAGLEKKIWRI